MNYIPGLKKTYLKKKITLPTYKPNIFVDVSGNIFVQVSNKKAAIMLQIKSEENYKHTIDN